MDRKMARLKFEIKALYDGQSIKTMFWSSEIIRLWHNTIGNLFVFVFLYVFAFVLWIYINMFLITKIDSYQFL